MEWREREDRDWRYRASSWIRPGVGKRQGHSFAFPCRWVLQVTEGRVSGKAVDREVRKKPASKRPRLCTCVWTDFQSVQNNMWVREGLQCSPNLVLGREK